MASFAPKTFQMVADNVGNPEPITVPVACRSVRIRESVAVAQAQEWILHAPTMADAGMRFAAGEAYEIPPPANYDFAENTIVGYIETVTGSTTFHAICTA